ncbi:MAG: molecular chaperone DnaJ [Sphaerospermopsis sp. SIO1G2]|nr:molecular chaperone DnaJ [Sphaerospermopsis sp. SIO1G1]NET69933.1 molecular chaperone DnaJ [Sphaerospermopsis sp. SIO1G2]
MKQNPYDILGLSQLASKAEIAQAVALAIKEKKHPIDAIAKAQKSLIKTEERIIADYLRPILPPIEEFQWSQLPASEQSTSSLTLLSEFDGLDQAIAQALQQQQQERETLPLNLSELFSAGVTACKEGRYPKAIKYLEDYREACTETHSQNYLKATICLIKAYQMGGQLHRAITLCKSLINHSHPQVNTWANKILAILSK